MKFHNQNSKGRGSWIIYRRHVLVHGLPNYIIKVKKIKLTQIMCRSSVVVTDVHWVGFTFVLEFRLRFLLNIHSSAWQTNQAPFQHSYCVGLRIALGQQMTRRIRFPRFHTRST